MADFATEILTADIQGSAQLRIAEDAKDFLLIVRGRHFDEPQNVREELSVTCDVRSESWSHGALVGS